MKNKKRRIVGTLLSVTLALSEIQTSAQAFIPNFKPSTTHSSIAQSTESQQFYLPGYCLVINLQKPKQSIIDLNQIIAQYEWINPQIQAAWKNAQECSTVENWENVVKHFQPIMEKYSIRTSCLTDDYVNVIKDYIIFARYYHALANLTFQQSLESGSISEYKKIGELFENAANYYKQAIETYICVYSNLAQKYDKTKYDKTKLDKVITACYINSLLATGYDLCLTTDINHDLEAWKKAKNYYNKACQLFSQNHLANEAAQCRQLRDKVATAINKALKKNANLKNKK